MDPIKYYKPINDLDSSRIGTFVRTHPELYVFDYDNYIEIVDTNVHLKGLQEASKLRLKTKCQSLITDYNSRYSTAEVQSFDQQYTEAIKYQSDKTYVPPLLSVMAENRGISLDELVEKIIYKRDAASNYIGEILGKRQNREKAIDACETIEKLKELLKTEII